MNGNELWGVGRTFLISAAGLLFGFILILLDKIPHTITLGEWTTLIGTLTGIFAAKSIGHKMAEKKNGKTPDNS